MKDNIPPAPQIEKIKDDGAKRLSEWITYFESLSDRIEILKPCDENFNLELSNFKKSTIELQYLDEGYGHVLHGWPKPEEIAFVVKIDSSRTNSLSKPKDLYTRIFCFGNRAFGLNYFEWDGDGEDDPECKTFSTRNFSDNALSWLYITKLIRSDLQELSETVPHSLKK